VHWACIRSIEHINVHETAIRGTENLKQFQQSKISAHFGVLGHHFVSSKTKANCNGIYIVLDQSDPEESTEWATVLWLRMLSPDNPL
jgi:hypothetical protein